MSQYSTQAASKMIVYLDEYVENVTAFSSNKSSTPEAPETLLLDSFASVGFSAPMRTSSKSVQPAPRRLPGDLVTLKAVHSKGPRIYEVSFPRDFAGRLIGKGGKGLAALSEFPGTRRVEARGPGTLCVVGSETAATSIVVEVRRLVNAFVASDLCHATYVSQAAPKLKASPQAVRKSAGGRSNISNARVNAFRCLEEEEEEEEGDKEIKGKSIVEAEEDQYDLSSLAGCSWVSHRKKTAELLQTSLKQRPRALPAPTSVVHLPQEMLCLVLSFISGDSDSFCHYEKEEKSALASAAMCSAIAKAGQLFSLDRQLAFYGCTARHRTWRVLAVSAWRNEQLPQLCARQPILWPLACAAYVHQQILPSIQTILFQGSLCLPHQPSAMETFCADTARTHEDAGGSGDGAVRALLLEYTVNPRTGRLDAAVVKGFTTYCSVADLPSEVKDLGTGNYVTAVPCFNSTTHWNRFGSRALAILTSLGCKGNSSSGGARQPGTTKVALPPGPWMRGQQVARGKDPQVVTAPVNDEIRLLAPLRPLLVCVKTAMVRACDGTALDLDAFLAI
jgi:hypothetical protein